MVKWSKIEFKIQKAKVFSIHKTRALQGRVQLIRAVFLNIYMTWHPDLNYILVGRNFNFLMFQIDDNFTIFAWKTLGLLRHNTVLQKRYICFYKKLNSPPISNLDIIFLNKIISHIHFIFDRTRLLIVNAVLVLCSFSSHFN